MSPHEPTIASILQTLATQFDGPVSERHVLERVLEQRPSTAKNPYATIRERLRWDGPSLGWLRLDRSELVPVRIVLQGLRFRHIPNAQEVETGLLSLERLQPFVGLRETVPVLQDATGAQLTVVSGSLDAFAPGSGGHATCCDVRFWMARTRFELGDSIIVTVVATEPLTLQMVRESRADFRVNDVIAQDAELLQGIIERARRSRLPLIPCDELVLPVFARAAWRTSYPGHPWQQLVSRDGRLQIINDVFLAKRRSGHAQPDHSVDSHITLDESVKIYQEIEETKLAQEIDALQHDIRQSRQQDRDSGVWAGDIQRASANHSSPDSRSRAVHNLYPPDATNLFQDHNLNLEDLGDDWELDDWDDELFEDGDDLDFEEFVDQNPDLFEASQRLMAALPPETLERLQDARMEEAEVIIAAHLNDLLVREPSLFVKMDLSPVSERPPDLDYPDYSDPLFELDMAKGDDTEPWDPEWEEEWDDDFDVQIPSVYTHSGELMSQFHDYLLASGKSPNTARSRTRDLWVYAEFLAHYYGRTLAEGDYATLDECLFFFYPCKVLNPTARQIREICTSLKQFYTFLKEREDITNDQFAHALWRRRDQAARVVELYEQLSREWSSFDRLFTRLFDPYTI